MCDVNYDWRDDDPTYVPGVMNDRYARPGDRDYERDPMEILSDQDFLDWVEGKDLQP